jgi:hypothetical protein
MTPFTAAAVARIAPASSKNSRGCGRARRRRRRDGRKIEGVGEVHLYMWMVKLACGGLSSGDGGDRMCGGRRRYAGERAAGAGRTVWRRRDVGARACAAMRGRAGGAVRRRCAGRRRRSAAEKLKRNKIKKL